MNTHINSQRTLIFITFVIVVSWAVVLTIKQQRVGCGTAAPHLLLLNLLFAHPLLQLNPARRVRLCRTTPAFTKFIIRTSLLEQKTVAVGCDSGHCVICVFWAHPLAYFAPRA